MVGTYHGAAAHELILPRLKRAFWIGAIALVGIGLTFVFAAWLNHRGTELVLDSQRTGRIAREARALALDRETAIRGYLLSHQQISLAPEIAASKVLPSKLDSLILLSAGNASQQDRARAIRSAVARWERGFVKPVLDPAIAGSSERQTIAGKELFDAIRSAFDSFLTSEQRIFGVRVRMLGALQRFSVGLIILEIAALLVILIWLNRRSIQQAQLLIDQQQQLQTQSLDLQQQAAELEEQAMELEEQADEANRTAHALAEANSSLEETIRRLEHAETTATTAVSSQREAQSLLDVVMMNAPVGVALYDSKRRIVRVNPAGSMMTGLAPDDHVGKTVDDLFSDDISEPVDAILEKVLEHGETVVNIPLVGTSKFSPLKDRHFLCSFFPVILAGNQSGVGAIVLETTQFKQLEEQLMQSQKMEAVGRLAGGVAHDFNNMLTAIMSYSELILADLPEGANERADMIEIMKAAEKATALTRKLLAFSRQQVLRPSRVDLNATVEGLQKMITRLLGSDISLALELDSELWNISVDPTEIERVLMNLVINARDAMPRGGRLIIETANVDVDDEYAGTHPEVVPGQYAMIAVTDNGTGMTRDVRDKVFEPFFTTKEKGKGTGLGLPSVYGIVKQSGGFVWVYSEVEKGTTFKIYLPRAEGEVTRRRHTPNRHRQIGSETILLVEDDEEVRQVATRILRRNGYRVLEAANGVEALRVAEDEGEPVDLIVTDLVMPEMGGTEFAEKIRETQPEVRILFTSGYTEDAVVRQSLLQAGEAFIEKPFTPAKLANKARELLRSGDGANE